MSGYPATKIRQPGGIRVKCQGGYEGACDCGVFNNYGAPAELVVSFGHQWSMTTVGWCSAQCGYLNDPDPSLPPGCPYGGAAGGPFNLLLNPPGGTLTGTVAILLGNGPTLNTFAGTPAKYCTYWLDTTLAPLRMSEPCFSGGLTLGAILGYDPAIGVFLSLTLSADNGSNPWLYYAWTWLHLPVEPGLLGCEGETQVPPAFCLDRALNLAALAGNYFTYEWDNNVTPCAGATALSRRFLCLGCNSGTFGSCGESAGTFVSQGSILAAVGCQGGSRAAQPCCCGGEPAAGDGCLWLCSTDPACSAEVGSNFINVRICPQADGTFRGSSGAFAGSASYDPSGGGAWTICYSCGGGPPTCQTLSAGSAGWNASPALSLCQGNVCVGLNPPCTWPACSCCGDIPQDWDVDLSGFAGIGGPGCSCNCFPFLAGPVTLTPFFTINGACLNVQYGVSAACGGGCECNAVGVQASLFCAPGGGFYWTLSARASCDNTAGAYQYQSAVMTGDCSGPVTLLLQGNPTFCNGSPPATLELIPV